MPLLLFFLFTSQGERENEKHIPTCACARREEEEERERQSSSTWLIHQMRRSRVRTNPGTRNSIWFSHITPGPHTSGPSATPAGVAGSNLTQYRVFFYYWGYFKTSCQHKKKYYCHCKD